MLASLALCGYGTIEWQTGTTPRKRDAEVVVARVEALEFSTVATGPQACNGDSGGPLYVSAPDGPRIAGIVSRAASDSEMCDTGAIITRVGPYAAWIAEASRDRDAGCNAGGGSAGGLLAGLAVLLAPRRRRIPG